MNDEARRKLTTYRVQKAFGKKSNVYQIEKVVCDTVLDTYHATVNPINHAGVGTLWCDCPGFRRQNYAKDKHKHVILVMDFQSRGEPVGATYTIEGTGQRAVIKYLIKDDEGHVVNMVLAGSSS